MLEYKGHAFYGVNSEQTAMIDVAPRYTAAFSIKVVNNGSRASAYFMRAF